VHDAVVYTAPQPTALTSLELFKLNIWDGSKTLVPDCSIEFNLAPREKYTFVPVQLIEGADGAPTRVLFRSATVVKQFVTQLPIAEEQQLKTQQARLAAAGATLRELRKALPRSAAAVKAAVAAAQDGGGDMNELGALTYEQHRITAEIERLEALEKQSPAECARLQKLIVEQQQRPRHERRLQILQPHLTLTLGTSHTNTLGRVSYILKPKREEHVVEVDFGAKEWTSRVV